MRKLLNAVALGLIFFSFFLIAFIFLFAFEHEVKALSYVALGCLIGGLGLGAVSNREIGPVSH